jgi:hypothetical protein
MSAIDLYQKLFAALDERLRGEFKPLDRAMASYHFAEGAIQCEALIQKLTLSFI